MDMWSKKNEPRRGAAVLLLASLSLAACSTTPRTELSWNADTALHHHHTVYGPRVVTLPPVRHHRVTVAESRREHVAREETRRERVAREAPRRENMSIASMVPIVPTPRPDFEAPSWYAQIVSPRPVEAVPASNVQVASLPEGAPRFKWPVAGRIIAGFGATVSGERNDGVNIATVQGEPIHAAAAGTISYCGNELKGYGNLILIRHNDGYVTAYAHADTILVGRGDRVAAGQVIGTAGATGDVVAPQLHFEVRRGVRPVDPKTMLPKTLSAST